MQRGQPGSPCDVPVHTLDYYPTGTALAGAKPAANQKLDGEDLVPLCRWIYAYLAAALFWFVLIGLAGTPALTIHCARGLQ